MSTNTYPTPSWCDKQRFLDFLEKYREYYGHGPGYEAQEVRERCDWLAKEGEPIILSSLKSADAMYREDFTPDVKADSVLPPREPGKFRVSMESEYQLKDFLFNTLCYTKNDPSCQSWTMSTRGLTFSEYFNQHY